MRNARTSTASGIQSVRDRTRARRRRGIALLDVIIGAVILGIGLAVVVSLSSRSLAAQTDGENRITAAWLADELLTMVLVEGPHDYPRLHDLRGRFDDPFDAYAYEVDIRGAGLGEAHLVTATVWWERGRGIEEIHVQTFIAPRLGDPHQPREPKDLVDREGIHYERRFGDEL